jgi:uncharacterized protein (DUF1684 family)
MKIPVSCFFCLFPLLLFCGKGEEKPVQDAGYIEETATWRKGRFDRLRSSDGWLTLAGLYWLQEGDNTFGSSVQNDIVFPAGKAPEHLGTFLLRDGEVRMTVAAGVEVFHGDKPVRTILMQSDIDGGKPTSVRSGTLTWYIIDRNGNLAVRLKDSESELLKSFQGLDYFPVDKKWRVAAQLHAHDRPKSISIATILGTVDEHDSPGTLHFRIGEQSYTLDPIFTSSGQQLSIIFADATSGVETYGGGRFVVVDLPDVSGRTYIDFNRAYNPPCAFTDYSTCPLPPKQNRLDVKIAAGERTFKDEP